MKAARPYIFNFLILAFQAYLFYQWQFDGSEPAGNMLFGLVWTFALLAFLASVGFISNEDQVDEDPQVGSTWFTLVCFVKMLALLYVGAFWTYGIYLLSVVLIVCRRAENEKRLKARVEASKVHMGGFGKT